MIQLVKWYPDQIARHWTVLSPTIEFTLPPIASNKEDRMDKVLESLLCGKLELYVAYDDSSEDHLLYGILVTAVTEALDSSDKALLVYSLYGYKKTTMEQVDNVLDGVKKIAIKEGCSMINAYTTVPHLIALLKSKGWNTDYTYVRVEV